MCVRDYDLMSSSAVLCTKISHSLGRVTFLLVIGWQVGSSRGELVQMRLGWLGRVSDAAHSRLRSSQSVRYGVCGWVALPPYSRVLRNWAVA